MPNLSSTQGWNRFATRVRSAGADRRADLYAVLTACTDWLREVSDGIRHTAADRRADLHSVLASTGRLMDLAESVRQEAVRQARLEGWSWEAIGSSLGVSKQAAQQRYGRLIGEG